MKLFVPDPGSLAPAFFKEILAALKTEVHLSAEARLRCLEHLERAEKLVCQEIVRALSAHQATLVVQIANLKSETTCLNKKLSQQ